MPSKIWSIPFGFLGIFVAFFGVFVVIYYSIVIGAIATVFGLALGLVYFMFRPKYATNCFIWLDRPGQMARYIYDKGGRFTNEDGTFYYQFKNLKDTTQAISFDLLYPTKKGEVASFFSPAPGQYFPMRINKGTKKVEIIEHIPDSKFIPKMIPDPKNKGSFIPDPAYPMRYKEKKVEKDLPDWRFDIIPENQREWLVLKQTRMKQRYQTVSNWDRWYPILALAIIMILVVIVISALFNSLNPFVDKLTSMAGTIAGALDRNAKTNQLLLEFLQNRTGNASVTPGLPTPPDVPIG